MSTGTDTDQPRPPVWSRFHLLRLAIRATIAAAMAGVANGVLYVAIQRISGAPLLVTEGPGSTALLPLRLSEVLVASAVPAVPALVVWVTLRSYTSRAREIFLGLSLVVFLLSLVPVFGLPSSVTTQLTLAVMHALAAGLISGALLWRSA